MGLRSKVISSTLSVRRIVCSKTGRMPHSRRLASASITTGVLRHMVISAPGDLEARVDLVHVVDLPRDVCKPPQAERVELDRDDDFCPRPAAPRRLPR